MEWTKESLEEPHLEASSSLGCVEGPAGCEGQDHLKDGWGQMERTCKNPSWWGGFCDGWGIKYRNNINNKNHIPWGSKPKDQQRTILSEQWKEKRLGKVRATKHQAPACKANQNTKENERIDRLDKQSKGGPCQPRKDNEMTFVTHTYYINPLGIRAPSWTVWFFRRPPATCHLKESSIHSAHTNMSAERIRTLPTHTGHWP